MSAIILHGLSVAQLDPWRLALWVAVTENLSPLLLGEVCLTKERTSCCAPVYDNAELMGYTFEPHCHWSQGGPLVEKYGISLYSQLDGKGWLHIRLTVVALAWKVVRHWSLRCARLSRRNGEKMSNAIHRSVCMSKRFGHRSDLSNNNLPHTLPYISSLG